MLCITKKPRQVKRESILDVQGRFDAYWNTKATNARDYLVAELGQEVKGCSSGSRAHLYVPHYDMNRGAELNCHVLPI